MNNYVKICTDGSCLSNPGSGGYGSILSFYRYEKILSAGYYITTNNRMELIAAIVALESLEKQYNVVLITDSQYVRLGITCWINNWKKYNWKTVAKKPIKNIDLWKRLDIVKDKHYINWEWIKGHNGHKENERCDKLARMAALKPTLYDIGYQL